MAVAQAQVMEQLVPNDNEDPAPAQPPAPAQGEQKEGENPILRDTKEVRQALLNIRMVFFELGQVVRGIRLPAEHSERLGKIQVDLNAMSNSAVEFSQYFTQRLRDLRAGDGLQGHPENVRELVVPIITDLAERLVDMRQRTNQCIESVQEAQDQVIRHRGICEKLRRTFEKNWKICVSLLGVIIVGAVAVPFLPAAAAAAVASAGITVPGVVLGGSILYTLAENFKSGSQKQRVRALNLRAAEDVLDVMEARIGDLQRHVTQTQAMTDSVNGELGRVAFSRPRLCVLLQHIESSLVVLEQAARNLRRASRNICVMEKPGSCTIL